MAWGELFGLLVMLAALFGMSAVLTRRAGVGSAAAPLAALALAELVLLASGLRAFCAGGPCAGGAGPFGRRP